ncbi:oligomeric complex COG6-domain-containing protein [Pisolithus marmoratus]|nr:oligomeric complex COG6-domain-containing protein [Pisolithus marmoratus]
MDKTVHIRVDFRVLMSEQDGSPDAGESYDAGVRTASFSTTRVPFSLEKPSQSSPKHHNTLPDLFLSTLTRGVPSSLPHPIEFHAHHHPISYIGDMLARVHQGIAAERMFFSSLFWISARAKRMAVEEEWMRDFSDTSVRKLSVPLKVRLMVIFSVPLNSADSPFSFAGTRPPDRRRSQPPHDEIDKSCTQPPFIFATCVLSGFKKARAIACFVITKVDNRSREWIREQWRKKSVDKGVFHVWEDVLHRLSTFGPVKSLDGFGKLDALGDPRPFAYATSEGKGKNSLGMNMLSGSTWKRIKLRIGEAKPDYRQRINYLTSRPPPPPRAAFWKGY